MRRDVYIENDSGGFSVLAAAAVDAIIDDGREDDMRFVEGFEAMLLELYGDDSMPVRVVVDEPLTRDEREQWLARASWRIDAPDGRLLVMGGFDPDVLGWWRDDAAPAGDGRGVAVVAASPGSWRVDVYAHAGSMNGRNVLDGAGAPVGAAFRRSHPDRAVPLWLAHMLELDGGADPGHEDRWSDVGQSIATGVLDVDLACASVVGLLVHLTPFEGPPPAPPEYGWFGCDEGARVPDVFPLGLPAGVPDPGLEHFLDRVLRRARPVAPPPPPAGAVADIIQTWSGDPSRALPGDTVSLALADAYLLYWIAAMAADSPPAFELWVTPPAGAGWQPPAPWPEFGVAPRSAETWAVGSPPGFVGWSLWVGARLAVAALSELPDGTMLELGTAALDLDEDADAAVGRSFYGGRVEAGVWRIAEAAAAPAPAVLAEALAFVRDVRGGTIAVRCAAERRALDAAAELYAPGDDELIWIDGGVRLAEPDERTLLLLAEQVFRARFGAHWPCDPLDADDPDAGAE